jgi:hypothetical protein
MKLAAVYQTFNNDNFGGTILSVKVIQIVKNRLKNDQKKLDFHQ